MLPTRKDVLYHKSKNLPEIKLLVQMKSEFRNKEDLSKEFICSFFFSSKGVLIQTSVVALTV